MASIAAYYDLASIAGGSVAPVVTPVTGLKITSPAGVVNAQAAVTGVGATVG